MKYEELFKSILNTNSFIEKMIPIGKDGQYAIKCTKENKIEKIWDFFGDSNAIPNNFLNAFKQCATGLESGRIHQLNSSSLLPFLCFWNVNTKGLEIDKTKYSNVFFEVKNKVFAKDSSVDVVLISDDGLNWLFLESKFTEPLIQKPYLDIKAPYKNIYDSISGILDVEVSEIRPVYNKRRHTIENQFSIFSKRNHYWEGIKQIISHLIGILQGPNGKTNHNHVIEGVNIKLGTILYDFSVYNVPEYYSQFHDYVATYSKVFTKEHTKKIVSSIKEEDTLNVILDSNCLEVLEKPLTYQDVFGIQNPGFLLPKVAEFYGLNDNSASL